MQHPFRHPLARHAAMTVLGYRRSGAPIYAIAGGNGEGEGGSGTPAPAAGDPTPPTPTPPAPATPPNPAQGDETDWKAMARQWEKRAKENGKAAEELEKLRKASQTDQEKAVDAARAEGAAAAAKDYGGRLAAAEFRAAVAAAGLQLGDAADLIDMSRFVTDAGDVDQTAIKAAVDKLVKLAPAKQGPGRSSTGGGAGTGEQPDSLAKQLADAQQRRDFTTVIRLKRQMSATT